MCFDGNYINYIFFGGGGGPSVPRPLAFFHKSFNKFILRLIVSLIVGLHVLSQLANTIQAHIGQMPSSRYRHIGLMQVADLSPSGFAPWANVDSASTPHRQTQQPSSGPIMGRCLAFLNRPNAGPTSARDRQTHQPSIGPLMGSCLLSHHWPDAGSTSANSLAQYRPNDGLMPSFRSLARCWFHAGSTSANSKSSIGPTWAQCWFYIGSLTAQHQPNHESNSQVCLVTCDDVVKDYKPYCSPDPDMNL